MRISLSLVSLGCRSPPPRPPRIGHGAKRVRKVRDDEAPASPVERENVVAQVGVRMLRGVLIAELDHPFAFGAIHCLVSFAGSETLARLHLGDDDGRPALHDQIDLSRGETGVARDDAVPAEEIEPGGAAFASSAEIA